MAYVGGRNTVAGLEIELDDAVASVERGDRIVIDTVGGQVPLRDTVVAVVYVKPQGVALADSVA